jgi:uroporphyrinogen decarboxylase
MLKNDRYIKAALSQAVDKTPVWMMRQAGRYLPEYRELRAQAGDFMSLCTNPELACEVTLQPLRRFDLDAAILFSDILTIPDAMGLGLYFKTGEGPAFEKPVQSVKAIAELEVPDIYSELKYVTDAVSTIRKALKNETPLIGFSGSPWTLATYMVEGGTTKNFGKVKGMMFSEPKAMHQLLDVLAKSVPAYLNAQIESGAQAVMVFDTWGGVLSTRDYQEFSLRYMQQIVDGLIREKDGQKIPVTLYTKGGAGWLEAMANTGADCIGLDWSIDIDQARARIGDKVALQGNMDPCILYSTPERIEREVADILAKFGNGNGHVFNLGHGIHPTIDPVNVEAYVNAVHQHSEQYHG